MYGLFKIYLPLSLCSICLCEYAVSSGTAAVGHSVFRAGYGPSSLQTVGKDGLLDREMEKNSKTLHTRKIRKSSVSVCPGTNTSNSCATKFANLNTVEDILTSEVSSMEKIFESGDDLNTEQSLVGVDGTRSPSGKNYVRGELFGSLEKEQILTSEDSSIEKIFKTESSTIEIGKASRVNSEWRPTSGEMNTINRDEKQWNINLGNGVTSYALESVSNGMNEDHHSKANVPEKDGKIPVTDHGVHRNSTISEGSELVRRTEFLSSKKVDTVQTLQKPSESHPKNGFEATRDGEKSKERKKGGRKKGSHRERRLESQEKLLPEIGSRRQGSELGNDTFSNLGTSPSDVTGKKPRGMKREKRKRKDSKRKKSVIHPNGLFDTSTVDVPKNLRRMPDSSVASAEASSLAFVFDSTGSMWDDLAQVKQGAVKILETIRERNPTLLADYILVPFQDPVVGPVTISNDHEKFLQSLQEIEVFSGGDCPEMTLSAIILALQACRPHSFVYVFTDARSKDYERINEVLPLIEKKQTQVIFVMTGDCGDPQHPGYQVFEKIAATSSGQVYHLNKTHVQEVLNFVRVSIQSHKVNLLAVDRSDKNSSSTEEHELPVDQTLKEFTVSVAGIHPRVQVTNPSGELPKNLTSLLDLENVKIVNVKQPDPGIWRVNVKSDAQYTIRSTGLSNIDFSYGFSVKPAKTLVETSHRPLKGTENSILIQTEPKNIQNLTMVCFLNVKGEILQNVTLEPLTPKRGVYSSEPFTPNGDYFYVSINGFSKNGTPLKRITPTAISPQLPAKPEIQPPTNYTSFVHQDITLKCHVESLVPFSVRWFKDNKAVGRNIHYPQTAVAEWTIHDLKSEDEGVYACQAKNAAGPSMERIYLFVTGNPPFIRTTEHVVSTPDQQSILECKVESSMTYNVTWFQGISGETRHWEELKSHGRYSFGNQNQLIINPTFESDAGWYQCVAQNSAGSGMGKLYLSVREEPKVSIEPSSMKVTKNGSFTLKCIVMRGTPKPKLLWRKDDLPLSDSLQGKYQLKKTENSSTLRVINIQPSDAGFYTCHAVNDINIITSQAFVEYVEAPVVQVEESLQSVKEGEFVRFKCQVSGLPQPEVSWLKNGQPIEINSNVIRIKNDLSILSVKLSDSGQYTCLAQNSEGSHYDSEVLEVGAPPSTIENDINDKVSAVNLGEDVEFHCVVNGLPVPSIVWNREGNASFLESNRYQISNDSVVLKIIETSLEDEGHYTCEAENIFGKTTLEFLLKITGTEAPKFAESGDAENVLQIAPGEKVYLSCSLTGGKPKPSVSWYHNQLPVNIGHSRFQQHENGSLTISKVEKFDGGTYVCVASNPISSIKKVFTLQTYEPPKFAENLQSWFHVLAGENVTIPCRVTSEPKGTVIWQRDGQILTADARISKLEDGLSILYARVEDTGTYVCTVTNPAGSASRAVALDVSVIPTISDTQENNITLQEGEDYKMPCTAIGTPNPDIKWRRLDKTFSAGYHDDEIFVLADNSLILSSVTPKMGGTYECIAQNKAGSASRIYTLTVNELEPPAEVSDVPITNLEVVESDVAMLECPLPSLSPPEWQKDGTELVNLHNERADEAHFALMDRQRIVRISESRISDSGDYSCHVENNDLESDTAIVRLNVVAAPSFEQEVYEPHVTVIEGEKLVLSCTARGNPQPKVQWQFLSKDTPITEYTFPGVYFEQSFKQQLVIPRTNHSRHEGHYQCSAANKLSTQVRDFHVEVIRIPVIKDSSVEENITASSGSSFMLKCSISSHPTPEVTWLHNGTSISPKPAILLEKLNNDFSTYFYSVNMSESGTGRYTCLASNKAGVAEKNFAVIRS